MQIRTLKSFKANVIVGKRKKNQRERIMFIRAPDILAAYDITKKVRPIRLNYVTEISKTEYLEGVSKQ
jgi:glutamine amidotransferase PdxT